MAKGDLPISDCYRSAGFSDSQRRDILGTSLERTKYPALWDYYLECRAKRLRLFDTSIEALKRELHVIAFSRITDFVQIPTRRDIERQELFDAKMRKAMGGADASDEKFIEEQARKELSDSKADTKKRERYSPNLGIKIRCLEDIPEELIPAIASIKETRDGIEIKLWNKLDAIDKMARINQLYTLEGDDDKPTTIENFNVIVNGTKSNLMDELKNI